MISETQSIFWIGITIGLSLGFLISGLLFIAQNKNLGNDSNGN